MGDCLVFLFNILRSYIRGYRVNKGLISQRLRIWAYLWKCPALFGFSCRIMQDPHTLTCEAVSTLTLLSLFEVLMRWQEIFLIPYLVVFHLTWPMEIEIFMEVEEILFVNRFFLILRFLCLRFLHFQFQWRQFLWRLRFQCWF